MLTIRIFFLLYSNPQYIMVVLFQSRLSVNNADVGGRRLSGVIDNIWCHWWSKQRRYIMMLWYPVVWGEPPGQLSMQVGNWLQVGKTEANWEPLWLNVIPITHQVSIREVRWSSKMAEKLLELGQQDSKNVVCNLRKKTIGEANLSSSSWPSSTTPSQELNCGKLARVGGLK